MHKTVHKTMHKILVTGAAGFIGFHLCWRLLEQGHEVIGIDNLNDYYDVQLKRDRLTQLQPFDRFQFHYLDISDRSKMERFFAAAAFDRVVHLAAQAGVRYSLTNPHAYVDSNLVGFVNLLEGCRHAAVPHLVFASSSSVYGMNSKLPFSVQDNVDQPISLYAATKKANELMAYTYSHLYGLPTTGLRFFTVYGPWGRPDMALFRFTQAILAGQAIDVFNHGKMSRDFTYIDDIVEGIVRVIERIPGDRPHKSNGTPYQLYNIGNHQPIELLHLIEVLESCLGIKAKKHFLPMQPGDVPTTFADVADLERDVGFQPSTAIETGVQCFVDWYRSYYSSRFVCAAKTA